MHHQDTVRQRDRGQRLAKMRTDAGLKQAELAEILGVTPMYVSMIERGERPGALDLLMRWAEACHASVADALGEEASTVDAIRRLQGLDASRVPTIMRVIEMAERMDDASYGRLAAVLELLNADRTG